MKNLTKKALQPLAFAGALGLCVVGAYAASSDDAPAAVSNPIKWYHPIKRALAPIEDLEGQGIKMEQAIMKLTGPITELSSSMEVLDKTMTGVASQLVNMKSSVLSTYHEVSGCRKDIAGMRTDIHGLKGPIKNLREPIERLERPLSAIKRQLGIIIFAVLFGGAATALGIPLSCIVFWKYRSKLMPKAMAAQVQAAEVQAAIPVQEAPPVPKEDPTKSVEPTTAVSSPETRG